MSMVPSGPPSEHGDGVSWLFLGTGEGIHWTTGQRVGAMIPPSKICSIDFTIKFIVNLNVLYRLYNTDGECTMRIARSN
jgi:hypothetical protein